jgi:hypothetical protein
VHNPFLCIRLLLLLLPVIAHQELLLLLDEYWARHPQLQGIPIYQASGVARKALNVFATYVAMMNQDIQKAIQVGCVLLLLLLQRLAVASGCSGSCGSLSPLCACFAAARCQQAMFQV